MILGEHFSQYRLTVSVYYRKKYLYLNTVKKSLL
jgi:hypothetical protein